MKGAMIEKFIESWGQILDTKFLKKKHVTWFRWTAQGYKYQLSIHDVLNV